MLKKYYYYDINLVRRSKNVHATGCSLWSFRRRTIARRSLRPTWQYYVTATADVYYYYVNRYCFVYVYIYLYIFSLWSFAGGTLLLNYCSGMCEEENRNGKQKTLESSWVTRGAGQCPRAREDIIYAHTRERHV